MLHNEARELLVEGDGRTYDVHSIEKAYGVTEREVYRLVKQKRDTGSVVLRTSQRRQKPKMTEQDLERLRTAIEKKTERLMHELCKCPHWCQNSTRLHSSVISLKTDKTPGELKTEPDLPYSESRLSRILREKAGRRRRSTRPNRSVPGIQ